MRVLACTQLFGKIEHQKKNGTTAPFRAPIFAAMLC
jgi:hypothetical protein